MANEIQYRNHTAYNNGTSAENNIKLLDITPFQHEDLSSGVNKLGKMLVAQSFCEPVAVCNSNNPQNGAYVATCSNYPDFALSYQDAQQNTRYLIGLKIRVIFTYGITYGSVSGGTYPTLNINGSGAIPMLAQGKTMATGSASAGQTLEFTVIPYGNGIAFDADSNVRESTSDYTIYTDGLKRVNSVTYNDKNMVTSGAVANELVYYTRRFTVTFSNYFTPNSYVSFADFVNKVVDQDGAGAKLIQFVWANSGQGYITIDANTAIRINGNALWGTFQYFKEGYSWVRSNFFLTDIDRGVVWFIDISRDTTNISTLFHQL